MNRTDSRRTCVLFGFHGMQNAGDDAFCRIMVDWIAGWLPVRRILIFGYPEKIPRVSTELEVQGVRKRRTSGIAVRLDELRWAANGNYIVYAAGSLFQRRDFFWLYVVVLVIRFWGRITGRRKRIAAIGVSLGPFRRAWDRYWCNRAINLFDVVLLRDQSDINNGVVIHGPTLLHGVDLAVLLDPAESGDRQQNPAADSVLRIGVALVDRHRQLGQPDVDDRKRRVIVEAIGRLQARGRVRSVCGFVFCGDEIKGDMTATNLLLQELQQRGIATELFPYHDNLDAYFEQLSKMDLMICNRMHAFVFSVLCRTAAFAIAYESKIIEFARNHEIPSAQVVRLDQLSGETVDRAIDAALTSGSADKLYRQVAASRSRQQQLMRAAAAALVQ